MTQFLFDSWVSTHTGKVRSINEDSYLFEPSAGLWAVADGMGGYQAGDLASRTVAENLATMGRASSVDDQRARFLDRLDRANQQVLVYSQSAGATMGSTVVALMAYGDAYIAAWVGDSRIYQLREGHIRQISRDHSEVQDMIEAGVLSVEEARAWPHRNVITRAVGTQEELRVDFVDGVFQHADSYIICSDGLTAHLQDSEIEAITLGRRPREACEHLIALVLDRGATDNVTVIIVNAWRADLTVPLDGTTAVAQ